jgi:aquaporin Z
MLRALTRHWPEYLIEATGLGLIVIAVCGFAMVLFHPDSPLVAAVEDVHARRVLMGLAMGTTAIALVYSPWGKQSGAHFNPAVTLSFYRLRRVPAADAIWYAISHLAGGLSGIGLMTLFFDRWLAYPAIHYVTTVPGKWGAGATWLIECAMAFLLMTIVLVASNSRRYARWTGLFVGLLLVVNVSVLVPLIGTSLNPARTIASAVPAHAWTGIWVYLTAAPTGMLLAAECFLWRHGSSAVYCAKLHHQNEKRCIFCESRRGSDIPASKVFVCNPASAVASNLETSTSPQELRPTRRSSARVGP